MRDHCFLMLLAHTLYVGTLQMLCGWCVLSRFFLNVVASLYQLKYGRRERKHKEGDRTWRVKRKEGIPLTTIGPEAGCLFYHQLTQKDLSFSVFLTFLMLRIVFSVRPINETDLLMSMGQAQWVFWLDTILFGTILGYTHTYTHKRAKGCYAILCYLKPMI